jgi:hypothetical protein
MNNAQRILLGMALVLASGLLAAGFIFFGLSR